VSGIQLVWVEGPCNNRRRKWDFQEQAGPPPQTSRCGGRDYVVSLAMSDGGQWVYVLEGGRLDRMESAEVRGRRDVFVAFRRLMRALAHGTPKELGRVVRAGKRARRAVR
jgi:hypothetical protein